MLHDLFFAYVCPTMGVLMSTFMYAAPISDLKAALEDGRLGPLNPIPWAIMTGNCVGWMAYAYYTKDPYILASNVPGVIVSAWLNIGAAKLQYYGVREVEHGVGDRTGRGKDFVLVPQEALLLKILCLWITILVCVGWFGMSLARQVSIIGVLVNINLLFFYGAPLQTIMTVISEGNSESIHRPLMRMNWLNTSFWVMYGFVARNDPVIYGPNALGLFFGIVQGVLCCIYPARIEPDVDTEPLLLENNSGEADLNNPVVEQSSELV